MGRGSAEMRCPRSGMTVSPMRWTGITPIHEEVSEADSIFGISCGARWLSEAWICRIHHSRQTPFLTEGPRGVVCQRPLSFQKKFAMEADSGPWTG